MRLRSHELLKVALDLRKLSQTDLARMARKADGTHPSAGFINHLAAGRRTTADRALALSISRILDVPADFLWDDSCPTCGQQIPQAEPATVRTA